MSPRRRRSAVLDADAEEAPSIEEVEAAALKAETRAEAAHARADELRRQAAKASGADRCVRWRSRLPALPTLFKGMAVAAAVVLIVASLVATGVMMSHVWDHHRTVLAERQRAAEFSAAARQSVVTMMTIDPATIRQDVQRMIDNSTGEVRDALEADVAAAMVRRTEQSKVKTAVTVRSVAIESMTHDSAVALVAATTEATNPDNTKLPVQTWRLSVTLSRDDGQLKLSKLGFV